MRRITAPSVHLMPLPADLPLLLLSRSILKSLVGDLPAPLKEAATSTSGAEFTLFAPTDAAFNTLFAMLPAGTAAKLKSNATAVGNLYVSRALSGLTSGLTSHRLQRINVLTLFH